jgi:membrane protein YdbS with pleckstrin-like domain
MFANFLHLVSRRRSRNYEHEFIREVRVATKPRRSRRLERLIVIGWVLIAVKSVAVVWAVDHYHVPFNPFWVIGPTVAFAALCTAVYFLRS